MSKLRTIFLAILVLALADQAFAQFGDCLYQHALEQPTELIHEVKLPPTAFAKTGGDRYNFRIYGVAASGDTLEMPWAYPVVSLVTSSLSLKQLNAGKTAQGDRFTYEASTTAPIQTLQLVLANKDFEGLVTLEGADKLGDWQTVLEDYRIIDLSNKGGPYRFTTLKFKSSVYRYYRITIKGVKDLKLSQVQQRGDITVALDTLAFEASMQGPLQDIKAKKTSIFQVQLAEPLWVDHVKLQIADTLRYVRQIEIQCLQDSFKQGEEMKYRYRTIARGSVSSLDPNQPIGFEPVVAQHLRVLIRNQDNQPLTVTDIEAGVQEPRINARLTGAEQYYLAYGCASLQRPQYDIAQDLARMSQRPSTLGLAPLKSFVSPIATASGLFDNPLWLYAALAVVAGLLGWMAIGMMRK